MRMKNKLLAVFTSIFICLSCMIPANAASAVTSNDMALVLNKLNILSGDSKTFNLDKPLTKSQAVTLTVSLIGKKDYVMQNKETYSITKFADVDSTKWYAPFIGFCVSSNLLGEFNHERFGPEDTMTEKNFLAIILKVLGYSIETDFTLNNIYQFAYELGLVTDIQYKTRVEDNKSYQREAAVKVLYNSLSKVNKKDKGTIIRDLITEGIVTRELAVSLNLLIDETKTNIEKVTPISFNKISVKFNEPIMKLQDSDIVVYSAKAPANPLSAIIESQTADELVIKTSRQTPGIYYAVEVSNITDTEGFKAPDILSKTFLGFKAPEVTSDFFKIARVEPISRNVVAVYFTHPVNINSEVPAYYEILEGENSFIKGSYKTLSVKCSGAANNAVLIYSKEKEFAIDTEYTLNVDGNLYSSYGVKLNDGQNESVKFTAIADTNEALSVISVKPLDSKTIQIELNKEVDIFYAQQILNYSIAGPDSAPVISKAVLTAEGDGKSKSIRLGLTGSLDKTKQYELKIKYLSDKFYQSILSDGVFPFSGKSIDKPDMNIKNARVEDNGTILIQFDRNLDPVQAVNTSNYSLFGLTDASYVARPVKVLFDASKDSKSVKVYLPSDRLLANSKSYKIRVIKSMSDDLGFAPSRDLEAVIAGTNIEPSKPFITDATIISSDTIRVRLSKEADAEAPNLLASNYSLEYKEDGISITKIPIFTGYIDSTTFVLKFDSLNLLTQYTLKFTSLKDFSGANIRSSGDGQNYISVKVGQ